MVLRLRIDTDVVKDHEVFRIYNWQGVLVVSEAVKQVLEECGDLGLSLEPVTA